MKINEKAATNRSIDHSVFFHFFDIKCQTILENYDFVTNIYDTIGT